MARAESAGLLRQGDLLLVPVGAVPEDGSVLSEASADAHVLAAGEATGHAHVLHGRALRLLELRERSGRWGYRPPARRYVFVDEPARLVHEEHLPITVGTGVYEVRRQREYRPARSVRVAD